jgi:septal ring factor EnvC (AmiA/AmiB activator)
LYLLNKKEKQKKSNNNQQKQTNNKQPKHKERKKQTKTTKQCGDALTFGAADAYGVGCVREEMGPPVNGDILGRWRLVLLQ